MNSFFFNIDVVGTGVCNLRCPSCPVGNSRTVANPTGYMEPDLLDRILTKAKAEVPVSGVGLFNWTEPLIHPQLADLIRVIHRHGLVSFISSNLNVLRNIDAVMETSPAAFRISVSGFTQEVYGATHRGGNIERVKANMQTLAEVKRKVGAKTRIEVLYHRYLGNLEDELLMKAFCEGLGFDFLPVWAFMMPLEKVLAFSDPTYQQATVNGEDLALIERLALPLTESIEIAKRHRSKPCILRDEQMTLDFQGNVQLCCTVFDTEQFTVGSYLEMDVASLQRRKDAHDQCMSKGLHVLFTYGTEEFEQLAMPRYLGAAPLERAVEPLELSGARGTTLLHVPTWDSNQWQEVVLAYMHAFGSGDDVTLVLGVDAAQKGALERAYGRLTDLLARQERAQEALPDILLHPITRGLAEIERLYATADWALPNGDELQLAHARRTKTRILPALSAEQLRGAVGREPAAAAHPKTPD